MKTHAPLQQRLEHYIAGRLCPALGCPGARFSLAATPLGINSAVYYLDIEGKPSLVLKALTKRSRFRQMLGCHAHLAGHGIGVPDILHAEEDGRIVKRIGRHIICEERIVGPTLSERRDSAELISAAARLFCSLHAVTRDTWGKIDESKTGGLHASLVKKMKENLHVWQDRPAGLEKKAVAWAHGWRQPVDRLTRFSLSHGDPNPGNIILDGSGRLLLLDTGHLRYLPRAIDFYTLQLNLCEDDEGKQKIFEDAYAGGMAAGDVTPFQETLPCFKAYVLVSGAAMLARRLSATAPGQPFYDDYVGLLQKARRMVAEIIGSAAPG